MSKYVIAVYVDNKPGVLTRVSSMFTRRAFNIDTLTVGEIENPDYSRITISLSGDEYTKNPDNMFPAQDFISRVCQYTDQIYVTSVIDDNDLGFTSLNGNIVIVSNDTGINVNCSNNNTILKETEN